MAAGGAGEFSGLNFILFIGKYPDSNPDANHAKYFISVQPENNKIHFSASNGGYINTKPGEPLKFKIDKEQKIANFQQELLPFIQQNYKNDPRVKKITIGHYKDDLYIHLA